MGVPVTLLFVVNILLGLLRTNFEWENVLILPRMNGRAITSSDCLFAAFVLFALRGRLSSSVFSNAIFLRFPTNERLPFEFFVATQIWFRNCHDLSVCFVLFHFFILFFFLFAEENANSIKARFPLLLLFLFYFFIESSRCTRFRLCYQICFYFCVGFALAFCFRNVFIIS